MPRDVVATARIVIGLDQSEAQVGLDKLLAEVKSTEAAINRSQSKFKVGIDKTRFDAELAELDAKLKVIEKKKVKIAIEAVDDEKDTEGLLRKKLELRQQVLEKQVEKTRENIKRQTTADRLAEEQAEDTWNKNKIKAEQDVAKAKREVKDKEFSDNVRQAEDEGHFRDQIFDTEKARDIERQRVSDQHARDTAKRFNDESNYIGYLRSLERDSGLERAKELASEAALRKSYQEAANKLLTVSKTKVKVTADIRDAEAKLLLIREQAKHDGVTLPVKLDLKNDETGKISKKAEGVFESFKKFINFGDINPGAGTFKAGFALTLSPLITTLVGSVSSLIGVLGSGLAGAAAIGGGALAGMGLNVLGVVRGLDSFKQETAQADKALISLEETTKKYGKNSEKAKLAQQQYNSVLKELSPAARTFSLTLKDAQEEWNKLTEKAIGGDLAKVVEQYTKTVKVLERPLAKNSIETAGILTKHAETFGAHVREPEEAKGIEQLGKDANKLLDPLLTGFENLGAVLLHVGEAALHIFAGPVGDGFKKWAEDLNNAYPPGEKLNKVVTKMGDDALRLVNFFYELSRVAIGFFGAGAASGGKFLDLMTKNLKTWADWEKSIEGKNSLNKFFEESNHSTESLLGLLGQIVPLFVGIVKGFVPIYKGFIDATTWALKLYKTVAELVGLKSPMEIFGGTLAVVFAAKKFAALGQAVKDIKELGAAKGLDKLLGFSSVGKGSVLAELEKGGDSLDVKLKAAFDYGAAKISEAGGVAGNEMRTGTVEGGAVAGEEEAAGSAAGGATGLLGKIPGAGVLKKLPGVGKIFGGGAAVTADTTAAEAVASGAVADTTATTAAVFSPTALTVLGPLLLSAGFAVLLNKVVQKFREATPAGKRAHEEAAPDPTSGLGGLTHASEQKLKELTKVQEQSRFEAEPGVNVEGRATKPKISHTQLLGREVANKEAKGAVFGSDFEQKALDPNIKLPSFNNLVQSARTDLEKLTPVGKESMLKFIKTTFDTLEGEGRITQKHAFSKFLSDSKGALSDLPTVGEQTGREFNKQLLAGIDVKNLVSHLKSDTNKLAESLQGIGLVPIKTTNWNEYISATAQNIKLLEEQSHSKFPKVREAAIAGLKELKPEVQKIFEGTRTSIETEVEKANTIMKTKPQVGTKLMQHAFQRLREVISAETSTGVEVVGDEVEILQQLFVNAMKVLDPTQKIQPVKSIKPAHLVQGSSGSGGFGPEPGAAQGALVQFGRAGQKGGDSIGTNIVVAPGEVGAIFTHEQQDVANKHLAPVGGLRGLFNKHNKPHYMAQGGFVADPGTNFSYGEEPQITSDLSRLGKAKGWTIYGISGYRSPQHSTEVGGFPNDPHTRGEAADIGVNSQLLESASVLTAGLLAKFGLERPFYPASAHEINHIQLLGSLAHPRGGAKGPGGKESAAAEITEKLTTPLVQGVSYIADAARGALKQLTSHANKTLAKTASIAGAHAEASGGGGSSPQNEALGKRMMLAAGFPESEWPFLQKLWKQESGWRTKAQNPTSPAYGIPQADPGDKMSSAGADWRTNPRPQIKWGLSYIKGSYGSPQKAWAQEVGSGFEGYAQGGMIEPWAWGDKKNYAKGGLYTKPALLVGEHEHEYVINPHRPDNAVHLKHAGEEMGYKVTPAGKGKKPVKSVIGNPKGNPLQDLPTMKPYAEVGGIPLSVIEGALGPIESALNTERSDLKTLKNNQTKEDEVINKARKNGKLRQLEISDAGGKDLAYKRGQAQRAIENAKKTSSRTVATAKEKLSKLRPTEGGYVNAETSVKNAETKAGEAVAKAERNAGPVLKEAERKLAERVHKAKTAEEKAVKEALAKKKHYGQGVHALEHGGVYEKEQYYALKTLEKDQKEGREAKTLLEANNEKIRHLNALVSDDTTRLNKIKEKYKTHPSEALKSEWYAVLSEREGAVKELKGAHKLAASKAERWAASKRPFHNVPQVKELIDNAIAEEKGLESTEEEDTVNRGTASEGGGIYGGPPTSEDYLVAHGKKEKFELLTEKLALAETEVVPNPAVPTSAQNLELPGLKKELPIAKEIEELWGGALKEAQTLNEPVALITELAGNFNSAKGSYTSLVQAIETAEKGVQSQIFQEAQEFGTARLALYNEFGGNFKPVGGQVPPSVAQATAAGSTGPAQGVGSQTTVNVTNHFTEPPPNPHHFSQGIAFELGAAI